MKTQMIKTAARPARKINGTLTASMAAVLLAAVLVPGHVGAATFVWNGAVDNNWSTVTAGEIPITNWMSNGMVNVLPPSSPLLTDLQFAGTTPTQTNNDFTGYKVHSIAFNVGAASFNLKGNPLTLGSGGITNNSLNAQTLSFPTITVMDLGIIKVIKGITLSASQTWNAAAGDLKITSDVEATGTPGTPTLTIKGARDTTISGIISNGGGVITLVKDESGKLVLTGANTYTGATTIIAGTLSVGTIGNGGVAGNLGAATTAAANLVFDGGTLQYTGAIASTNRNFTINTGKTATFDITTNTLTVSGASTATNGGLTKIGAGTLILTGADTYTGATTISAGTLQLGDGGTTGSLSKLSTITNNGTLAFHRTDTVTQGADFASVISGSGGVTQSGSGTLRLGGINTYTRGTIVDAGSLFVDGSITSNTLVKVGGLLGGGGFIFGNLVNHGIVSPDDSPGILHIAGNYTQTAGGTLHIEVAGPALPVAPKAHDLLAVGGKASLAGTLQVVRLNGFQLHAGQKITFLTAKLVKGTFDTVQNDFANTGTVVIGNIVYDPTSVALVGTQGSFRVCPTPNGDAVARALDCAASDPRASKLIGFLDKEPIGKLCGDFERIAPEELASVFTNAVSLAKIQTANLQRRLDDVRAGSRGFNSASLAYVPSLRVGPPGVTGPPGRSGEPFELAPEDNWGSFVIGEGEFTNVGNTANARGYDLATGGFTLGLDYRMTDNFYLGLIASYARSGGDLTDGGRLTVDGGKLGLYATYFTGGFYLDAAAQGGYNSIDTKRGALQGTARGATDGGEFNALFGAGYDWKRGGLTIGPIANFEYTYLGVDAFREQGSLVPLAIGSQHSESLRTSVGAKVSYAKKVGDKIIRPELRLAWQHEYGDTAMAIHSRFANCGCDDGFTVTGPAIGRDSLLIGAGFSALWSERVAIYLFYDGELGRTNYGSHNLSGGVRLTF